MDKFDIARETKDLEDMDRYVIICCEIESHITMLNNGADAGDMPPICRYLDPCTKIEVADALGFALFNGKYGVVDEIIKYAKVVEAKNGPCV